MNRKSYNAAHAEFVARQRAKNPAMAALWGYMPATPTTTIIDVEQVERDLALEAAALRLFGKVPQSPAEKYAAEQSLDAMQCLKGRGED